jgi:ribosomal protein S27AE
MTTSLSAPCPRCGAEELLWRVYRPAPASPLAARELRWTCRACAYEWGEPLSFHVDSERPMPPVSQA